MASYPNTGRGDLTLRGGTLIAAGAVLLALSLPACKGGSDDPCNGLTCSSRGYCITDQGTAYCACISGYHPVALACLENDPDDACRGVECTGHGDCVLDGDEPTCVCDPGYHHLDGYELHCVEDLTDGPRDTDDAADVDDAVDVDDAAGDVGCTPSAEACNSLDDDCDTETDEGCDAAIGTPCTEDEQCTPPGLTCNEDWGICVAPDCVGRPDFTPCDRSVPPSMSYNICVDGACVSPGCGQASCNVPGPGGLVADTNQRSCYDLADPLASCPGAAGTTACETTGFCGQDAQYGWDTTHAASARFTRTGDTQPIVTDNATGLVWQGCSHGMTGPTCTTGADWVRHAWSQVVGYCNGLAWAGSSDWRLPSEFELLSILDFGIDTRFGQAIDTDAFPHLSDHLWTSSTCADDDTVAWAVSMSWGYPLLLGKAGETDYLCVRGGAPVASAWSRDVVAGDPVVTDAATGLAWQGCPAGMTGDAASCTGTPLATTWQAALDYCQDSTWAGTSDWYLPNPKELHSIIDNRRSSPAISPALFPNTPSARFWTSTSSVATDTNAWCVDFTDGSLLSWSKTPTASDSFHVRCVRAGPG